MEDVEPEIGLVIRHAYLWWNEARKGRQEGSKDRPCVIVHVRKNEFDATEVYISPITHTPPQSPEKAIALPQATKVRLGLDDQKSWVITTEVNRFIWPGPDLRPIPAGGPAYGLLPAAMTRDIIGHIKENARDKSLLITGRDDETLVKTIRTRRPAKAKSKAKTKG